MFCCRTRSTRSCVCNLNAMVRHLLVRNILAGAARHVARRTILLLRMMRRPKLRPRVAAQAFRTVVCHPLRRRLPSSRSRADRGTSCTSSCRRSPACMRSRAAPHTATSPFPPAPLRPGVRNTPRCRRATRPAGRSPANAPAGTLPSRLRDGTAGTRSPAAPRPASPDSAPAPYPSSAHAPSHRHGRTRSQSRHAQTAPPQNDCAPPAAPPPRRSHGSAGSSHPPAGSAASRARSENSAPCPTRASSHTSSPASQTSSRRAQTGTSARAYSIR